MDTVGALFSS